jgi:hypothetical protein
MTGGMVMWRAGCGESRTSGSEGGPGRRTSRKAQTAPCARPYFSDRQPGTSGPRRVTQAEIRGTFFADWRVDSIVPEHFSTLGGAPGSGADKAEAWLASLTRIS